MAANLLRETDQLLAATARDTSERIETIIGALAPVARAGFVTRAAGELVWSSNFGLPIGTRCMIQTAHGALAAEVVGCDRIALMLMAERGLKGVRLGDRVTPARDTLSAMVGDCLLGRVIDAYGDPLDGKPLVDSKTHWPLAGVPINPMRRSRVAVALDVGIRAINGMTTIGRGMRIGLFAGSGVGKSTLLGMAARHAQADCVVIAMIGERGREVREFIEDHLGDSLSNSVVVVSAADSPPLARVQGAQRAAAIAEHFRARGRHVLFLVDSLTRLAMAGREIGLSVGEPPATKGYPPSVFGQIAAYVERAGNGEATQGSITAVYTVLVEGDDHVGDPVADTARAVLDGHVVLSRKVSEAGLYPPIDLSMSLSRPMPSLVSAEHLEAARRFRLLWSRLAEKRELVDIGVYAPGRDPVLDEALACSGQMEAFLRQSPADKLDLEASVAALRRAVLAPAP
jgi:flagellum-specific ATP synthase